MMPKPYRDRPRAASTSEDSGRSLMVAIQLMGLTSGRAERKPYHQWLRQACPKPSFAYGDISCNVHLNRARIANRLIVVRF